MLDATNARLQHAATCARGGSAQSLRKPQHSTCASSQLHAACRANGVPVLPDWRRMPPHPRNMKPSMSFPAALSQPKQHDAPRLIVNHYMLRARDDYAVRQARAKGENRKVTRVVKTNRGLAFFEAIDKCDAALAHILLVCRLSAKCTLRRSLAVFSIKCTTMSVHDMVMRWPGGACAFMEF